MKLKLLANAFVSQPQSTRKPTEPRIMVPENPVIKYAVRAKKTENPCCCGVLGIPEIIPTQQAILDTLHFCLDFVIICALYDLYYPVSMDYTDLLLSNRYHH